LGRHRSQAKVRRRAPEADPCLSIISSIHVSWKARPRPSCRWSPPCGRREARAPSATRVTLAPRRRAVKDGHRADAHHGIIEDDPDLRDALGELLSGEGYEVATAADGREGLRRLGAPPRPCLVLLDLMLPAMDGFEFRLRQLEDPALAAIPVIVFSGGGDV